MAVTAFENIGSVLVRRKSEMDSLVNGIARRAMTVASDYVTEETPVKTGAARSNWVLTLDEPFEGILPPYAPFFDAHHGPAPVERKGETENRDAARAQNQTGIKLFDYLRNAVMFLRNNVGHISLLEAGWSRQTEAGMFARSVEAARAAIVGGWKLKA